MSVKFEWNPVLKDPNATRRHGIDWASLGWLPDGETITAQEVFSDDPALLIDQVGHANGIVSWRVRGGVAGNNYVVTCRITMSNGDGDDRSLLYQVRER